MVTLMAIIAMPAVFWAQSSAPSMPEAVINLNKFNGTWEANISSTMGDSTYQFDYNVKCMPIAGGNGAYWEENGLHPALGEMHASDLLGYDRSDGKLHCFSVDNMGTTRDYICEWKSPDHLIMMYKGIENGKNIVETSDFAFSETDKMDINMSSIQDGKTQWSGSGTFHRVIDK
jgi:hypothetical protein